jgi:hypothetical protein
MKDLFKVAAVVIGVMVVPLCFIFPAKIGILAGVAGGFILLCMFMLFVFKDHGG